MKKIKIGLILMIIAIVLLIIERLSSLFSNFFGKIICGENYLQKADGILTDASCGFNNDMYIGVILLAVFIIGLVLVIIGFRKNKKS